MSQESADSALAPGAPAILQTAYPSAEPSWPNRHIWPVLLGILEENPTTGRQVFEIGSGTFPIVISLEVIEHCFSIKAYLETMFRLVEPGGLGIVSRPSTTIGRTSRCRSPTSGTPTMTRCGKAATSSSSRRRR